MENGELEVARDQFEATLSEARTMDDPRAISASLNNLGRLVGKDSPWLWRESIVPGKCRLISR